MKVRPTFDRPSKRLMWIKTLWRCRNSAREMRIALTEVRDAVRSGL